MNYWLMKSEPTTFSIEMLERSPNQTAPWDGVRNYQARNFMKQMQINDTDNNDTSITSALSLYLACALCRLDTHVGQQNING
jgi:predicted RNA-binding protein with PUA-like domain